MNGSNPETAYESRWFGARIIVASSPDELEFGLTPLLWRFELAGLR